MRLGRAAACLAPVALSLLVGCSTPPQHEAGRSVSGRLSLQVAASGGKPAQGLDAVFDLSGTGEQGELQLSTILGTTLARASWNAQSAILVTPRQERRFANLDELSREALGESMPLQALPDWLQGQPWAGAPSTALGSASARGFEQLGWAIDLARFEQGWLRAERPGPPAVVLRVRLDAAP